MSDRLVLKFKPPRPMERSDPRVFWAYGVMLSFLFLGWGLAGVVLMVAAQVALGVVAVRYFRQQLEIDQRHVTITHVWSVHRVPLNDVLFVSAGDVVVFVGVDRRVRGALSVGPGGRERVARFLQLQHPDLPVNPVEPWLDRRGVWHSELHRMDPLESIRSIRRAATGRWMVTIKVHDSNRFQAIAHTCGGPPGLWAGDEHPALAAATEDAVRMIGELRHEE